MAITQNVPTTIEELVDRYERAWGELDLETILSLQTPDSKFVLRGASEEPQVWDGIDACRECFDYLLRLTPDGEWKLTKLMTGENMYVAFHEFKTTFALPWTMAGKTYEPTGKPVKFQIVDVMHCEGNLVKVKDGWIDGFALHQQLERNAS